MKTGVLAVAAWLLIPCSSVAEQLGNFDCVAFSDFEQASVKTDVMKVGSFNVYEKLSGTDKQSAGLLLSYTAVNETRGLVYLAGDFLLVDGAGAPLAAINATPVKLFVEAGKSMVVNGHTIVSAGTLAAARKVCIRIHLSLPPRD